MGLLGCSVFRTHQRRLHCSYRPRLECVTPLDSERFVRRLPSCPFVLRRFPPFASLFVYFLTWGTEFFRPFGMASPSFFKRGAVCVFQSVRRVVGAVFMTGKLLMRVFRGEGMLDFQCSSTLTLLGRSRGHLGVLVRGRVVRRGKGFIRLSTQFLSFFRLLLRTGRRVGATAMRRGVRCLRRLVSCCLGRGVRSHGRDCMHGVGVAFRGLTHMAVQGVVGLRRGVSGTFGRRPACRVGVTGLRGLSGGQVGVRQLVSSARRLVLRRRQSFFHRTASRRLAHVLLRLQRRLRLSTRDLVHTRRSVVGCLGRVGGRIVLMRGVQGMGCLRSRFRLHTQDGLSRVVRERHSLLLRNGARTSFGLSPDCLTDSRIHPVVLGIVDGRGCHRVMQGGRTKTFDRRSLRTRTVCRRIVGLSRIMATFIRSKTRTH